MNILTSTKLTKRFGGVRAVNDCSFAVEKNKITALIGPNGSGKTTVFNLITGVLASDTGTIKYKKEDITNKEPHVIAGKKLTRMFQHEHLFRNLTVQENIEIALDKQNESFWQNFLRKKNDHSKAIDNVLGLVQMTKYKERRGDELSFGQQRLVELARTIATGSDVFLLDEPVGGVNPKIRGIIKQVLHELIKQGKTILLIEHDMEFVLSIADHVIVLDEGKVIAQGTPASIKKNKEVLEAYLGD